jgi:hypothetical protein
MEKAAVKPKNGLIIAFRKWHTWLGLAAAVFMVVVAITGVVLNYKKPIFSALGLENEKEKTEQAREPSGTHAKLTTENGLRAGAVSVERALELARNEWGNVPLERIELKNEHGTLLYKIKRTEGAELIVNAMRGTYFVKGEYEKIKEGKSGAMTRQFDWGKLMLNLHTGKIGGEAGKAVMSLAAVMLLFLTGSGTYLWLKPVLIRRANKSKARVTATAGQTNSISPHFAPAAKT